MHQMTIHSHNYRCFVVSCMQYPVIFYLAISVTVCTFIQPYKHLVSNILDTLLTADVLILLLIRNTSAISFGEDRTFSLTEDSNLTCLSSMAELKVTSRVYTLAPFYFIPLAAFVSTIVVSITYFVW